MVEIVGGPAAPKTQAEIEQEEAAKQMEQLKRQSYMQQNGQMNPVQRFMTLAAQRFMPTYTGTKDFFGNATEQEIDRTQRSREAADIYAEQNPVEDFAASIVAGAPVALGLAGAAGLAPQSVTAATLGTLPRLATVAGLTTGVESGLELPREGQTRSGNALTGFVTGLVTAGAIQASAVPAVRNKIAKDIQAIFEKAQGKLDPGSFYDKTKGRIEPDFKASFPADDYDAQQEVLKEIREALKDNLTELGVPTVSITSLVNNLDQKQLEQLAVDARTIGGEEAARIANARDLGLVDTKGDVVLTRGQVTGDVGDQSKEFNLAKMENPAGSDLRNRLDLQQDLLQSEVVPNVQGRLSVSGPIADDTYAASERVSKGLLDARQKDQDATNIAYKTATEAMPEGVPLNSAPIVNIYDDMYEEVGPVVSKGIDAIGTILQRYGIEPSYGPKLAGNRGPVNTFKLDTAEKMRQEIMTIYPTSRADDSYKQNKMVFDQVTRAIDNVMKSKLSTMPGEEQTYELMRQARTRHRYFMMKWENNNVLAPIMKKLETSPETLMNSVFKGTAPIAQTKALVKALSDQPVALDNIRSSFFYELINKSTIQSGRKMEFSAKKFNKLYRDSQRGGVLNELFTPEQNSALDQFFELSKTMTQDARAFNPGTAPALINLVRQMGGPMARMAAPVASALSETTNLPGVRQVKEGVQGVIDRSVTRGALDPFTRGRPVAPEATLGATQMVDQPFREGVTDPTFDMVWSAIADALTFDDTEEEE